ncbi:DUF6794 domain-containing protein [Lyngbya sp. CCY1209]|uniref:DUF6794 domain-containing protein n=1 Tax=Lyngbya sp. CCY1209 TaxID=2886103 RepID=UPI002D212BAF|nr:DUF6794 domain-containing protein [Lyngbya sp. CCY1209]MEB3884056.1 hypothetical protein [Lyngbya sp. CCY1209]
MSEPENPDKYHLDPPIDPDTGDIRIPENLEEAIAKLKAMLHPEYLDEIKAMPMNEFAATAHFDLGLWLRNNWGLWRQSPLAQSLDGFDADGKSDRILKEFWRSLQE